MRSVVGGADAPMTVAETLERQDELTRPGAVRVRRSRSAEQVECRLPDGRSFTDVRRPD